MIFSKFEPVVEPRNNVQIIGSEGSHIGFFKVTGIEPVGAFVKDFALSIPAGETSINNEFEEVYMDIGYMAQWRIWVLDDVEIRLNMIGRTSRRGTTKIDIGTHHNFSMKTNPYDEQSQFFVYEDEKIYFDIHNPTNYTSTSQRVKLMGFKYALERLEKEPEKYTDIYIGKI